MKGNFVRTCCPDFPSFHASARTCASFDNDFGVDGGGVMQVHDKLEMLPQARAWRLYALHSQMPTSQQRDVFLRPPRGIRKVRIQSSVLRQAVVKV